ncbi:MAG: hypothetical protein HKM04_01795 [Legionellales bacterium]|nr:hypothetical protein [Legionellales bacterium]
MIIFIGTFFFYISDSVLAQRKFDKDLDYDIDQITYYVIAITYWAAQFLIAQGAFKLADIKGLIKEALLT